MNHKTSDYRNLKAFQLAKELARDIYRLTYIFPDEEKFGLTSQMQRAAVSVASNIAEGSARPTKREFARFAYISLGSARELEFQLEMAHWLKYIQDDRFEKTNNKLDETVRTLQGFIRYLRDEKSR
jgi:four helix bundle protein